MNGAIITRVTGAAPSGGGDVVWDAGDDETSEFIRVGGGFYWLLANLNILDHDTLTDEETFEWDALLLTPRSIKFITREHTHFGVEPTYSGVINSSAGTSVQSSTGPRLIYHNPFQWWSYGQLAPGQEIRLNASHECEVELIAMKMSVLADTPTLAMELR